MKRWVFDPHLDRRLNFGDFTNSGVSTGVDRATRASVPCHRRIYVAVIAASSEVRAVDARTGALRWTWDPVPKRRGDPAYDT
ncbi:MAG: hypothetical protein ACT4PJ_11125 [Gemmatimonadaceae bacterium]